MTEPTTQIHELLFPLRRRRAQQRQLRVGALGSRVFRYALAIGLILFAITGAFGLWHFAIGPVAGVAAEVALTFAVFTILAGYLAMLSSIFADLCSLAASVKSEQQELIADQLHDNYNASLLDRFGKQDLERVKQFLEAKLARMRGRLAFVLGSPTVPVLIWGAVEKYASIRTGIAALDSGRFSVPQFAVVLVAASVIGALLGVLSTLPSLQRLPYHIHILALHLKGRP